MEFAQLKPNDGATPYYGVNLVGNITANSGLGVHARQIVELLLNRGVDVRVFDIAAGRQQGGSKGPFEHLSAESVASLPHALNLFVLDPYTLFHFLAEHHAFCFTPGRFNAAVAMWELPMLPPQWGPAFSSLDAVLAASDFVQGTYAAHLSGTAVIRAPCPLHLPDDIRADPAGFGFPEGATTFVSSFDPGSDPQRKNPFAAVRSFIDAFGDSATAALLIKANTPPDSRALHPGLQQLQSLCDGRRNIRVIHETLSYRDTLSLYASADVFVSLHRAEGLGLALMEAMALGKPVIATGWSGNMSFMDATSACLVGYALAPVQSELPAYAALNGKTCWAEPSQADASAWMRQLAQDHGLRTRIGQAARAAMTAYQRTAQAGHFIDELQAMAQQRQFLPTKLPVPAALLWAAARMQTPARAHAWATRLLGEWQRHVGWRLERS